MATQTIGEIVRDSGASPAELHHATGIPIDTLKSIATGRRAGTSHRGAIARGLLALADEHETAAACLRAAAMKLAG